ncbi:hypothetical protein BDZ90DRAFT_74522 [Jaminaea rosea]|uniref:Uncharacterized protein n=1 Tax=Jaminaea rosea TaxID=1569628 RepID=A0A316UKC4_9BASI|nr:hypothetical protein BDZ90DRAFT_74522 [Jaminaea rosea]PWN25384.1 hypothetical protein BDZ90DRAFT_74522 [Jaminaea rosea]
MDRGIRLMVRAQTAVMPSIRGLISRRLPRLVSRRIHPSFQSLPYEIRVACYLADWMFLALVVRKWYILLRILAIRGRLSLPST